MAIKPPTQPAEIVSIERALWVIVRECQTLPDATAIQLLDGAAKVLEDAERERRRRRVLATEHRL